MDENNKDPYETAANVINGGLTVLVVMFMVVWGIFWFSGGHF